MYVPDTHKVEALELLEVVHAAVPNDPGTIPHEDSVEQVKVLPDLVYLGPV